jgi:ABC-type polar amino acid transport system ATPase subunit
MLAGKRLSKSWGDTGAIEDVDVEIEPGKITVLIGPSGSGKTTLIRTLSLLEPPDHGVISLGDREYRFPLPPEAVITPPWPDVTVVFQQLFLWPHLRLRENITLPLQNRAREDSEDRLNELIEAFDMRKFIDRYPNETSLGQRQRAALVRALVLNPSYILLDEITSALDVEQVSIILKQLQELRGRGIGILLVTHLIGFARRAADKVIFLDQGRIGEKGTGDMLENPTTARLKRFLSVIALAT